MHSQGNYEQKDNLWIERKYMQMMKWVRGSFPKDMNSSYNSIQKDKRHNLKMGRSSHCGIAETSLTRNHEVVGLIPGLAQWVTDLALP